MAQVKSAVFNRVFAEANRTTCRYRVLRGSAGSGKSVNVAQDYVLRLADKRFEGANLLVVRKIEESNRYSTYAELIAAIRRIFGTYTERYWDFKQSPLEIVCKATGAKIIFRGMKDDGQKERIKSIAFARGKLAWIWIEEATELDEEDIDILDDRLRGELENQNLFYQMTFTFNPISASHWLKARYFDKPSKHVFTHKSTFLDNEFIDEAYRERMERRKIEDPDGYKVYGLGEWGILGGQFFSGWKETLHVVEPFAIPDGWIRFRAMDWGSYHPYCCLWFAVDYDGNLWCYRELYGYGHKPNVGTKETAAEVAAKIAAAEYIADKKAYEQINYAVLDSACWAKIGVTGPTVAEEINTVLYKAGRMGFAQSSKGREQGAEQVKLRLAGYKNKTGIIAPALRFFKTCYHSIRTIPMLTHDKHQPEKVDTTGEDHAYDALAYGCLSRPYAPEKPKPAKPRDRWRRDEYEGASAWAN